MNKKIIALVILSAIILSGCGIINKNTPATPTPVPTSSPIVESTPTPTPTATPVITPTPAPLPIIQPTPMPVFPKVTKQPTAEVVWEEYDCWFIANYTDAIWAVWHFVDPSGLIDLTYWEMAYYFPDLGIENGMYSNLHLYNIPYSVNGWRVYCEYSNNVGSVKTDLALLTVIPAPVTPVTPPPTPTPTPTQVIVTPEPVIPDPPIEELPENDEQITE